MKLGNNILFNAIRSITVILSDRQKKRGLFILFLSFLNALNDILGLGLLFGLIGMIAKQNAINTVPMLVTVKEIVGISDNFEFTFFMSVVVLLLTIAKNVVSQIIVYVQAKFAFDVAQELSIKQFQYFFKKGYLYIKSIDSGKKTYSAIDVPYQFGNYFLLQLTVILTEAFVSLIIVLGIFVWKPAIGIMMIFIIAPSILVLYAFVKKKVQNFGDERNKLYPKSHFVLLEALTGFADIQLSNVEALYQARFAKIRNRINNIDAKVVGIYQKLPQKFNEIIMAMGIMLILAAYYFLGGNKNNVIILLGSFGIVAVRIIPAINRMMNALLNLKNLSYVPSELIHLKEEVRIFEEHPKMSFNNALDLVDVTYSYPDQEPTLKGINLNIKKGEFVGVVGSSGAGKSTLLHILLQFVDIDQGKMKVDGKLINASNKSSYQKMLAYVQQDVFIMKGTILQNIAFGVSEDKIDMNRVKTIVQQTNLSSLISQFPNGLHHKLTEKGDNLSGGQKQRIAIARSLYKDSNIFIFDEPTSALDPETEQTISELIAGLTSLDKTIIVVAHRLTTLAKSDRIIVLEDGVIGKTVTYAELQKQKYNVE